MEASTGSGALLRRVPIGPRRLLTGGRGRDPPPVTVKMANWFQDEGHLRYYGPRSMPARCGMKEEEKRKMKLVKGLERDLGALYEMGFGVEKGEGIVADVKGQKISEAADVLLAQLTKLRTDAKELKNKRKQEKATKKAARMKDRAECESSSSSSSESSDSECEKTVVKMRKAKPRINSDPITAALQTEDVIEEAKNNITTTSSCCNSQKEKIEVCMGGKCKKSGAMELMAEFEKMVGVEGAVVGCKCMGKCRDGPNVRVVNEKDEDGAIRVSKGPFCIGVGLEDVGSIVASIFGEENKDVGLLPA